MKVVSNSTPLIHLSSMGRLDLLEVLFRKIIIPDEVYEEVVIHGKERPGCEEVRAADWISRSHIQDKAVLRALKASLGSGEAACIALASRIYPRICSDPLRIDNFD